uniref:cGMP-dependent protein kinase n=1 Tax=Macrostomum lignano TaxID=282301 RepID=A0A1I8FSZ3_9PLAT
LVLKPVTYSPCVLNSLVLQSLVLKPGTTALVLNSLGTNQSLVLKPCAKALVLKSLHPAMHIFAARSKALIRDAINNNQLLQRMEPEQVEQLVACMYSRTVPPGCHVIRQGEAGQHLYVCSEGELEVTQENRSLGSVPPRRGIRRAGASVQLHPHCLGQGGDLGQAVVPGWRTVFQAIMMKSGLEKQSGYVAFLMQVLTCCSTASLAWTRSTRKLTCVREGEHGSTFFIIKEGTVRVTRRVQGSSQLIRTLQAGDCFGERALLQEERRTASCIAETRVHVLTLDRISFIHLIGDLTEFKQKAVEEDRQGVAGAVWQPAGARGPAEQQLQIELSDLVMECTLGIGGFGRVELVSWKKNPELTFALKCLKKQHTLCAQNSRSHILSERTILFNARSNFICRGRQVCVYMLMEVCLGAAKSGPCCAQSAIFDESTSRFVVACVLEAFQHLHDRGIIFRDLKPENLLLDNQGYVKLLATSASLKRSGRGKKTWTFCGTPEYVSPEVILNKGHSFPTDIWQIGILLFELLTGRALIKRLCKESPSERLGSGSGGIADVRKHKWFQGFDWAGLRRMSIIRGPNDASNFDKFEPRVSIPPDEISGWDNDF